MEEILQHMHSWTNQSSEWLYDKKQANSVKGEIIWSDK